MSDYLLIEFSRTEETANGLLHEAQTLLNELHRMQRAYSWLMSSGLHGSFIQQLEARWQHTCRMIEHTGQETEEAGRDLLTVVQWARDLNAEGARRFDDYATRYGLGNVAWDTADIVSQLWLRQGAGETVAKALLKELGLNASRASVSILGGVVGGLVDYGLEYGDEPFNGRAFATEVSSGALQGLVGMTGVGGAVMLGNTVVQLGGHALTYGVYQGAELFSGGDPALAAAYRRQANDLNAALDAGNLDNAFDAVTENVIDIFVEPDHNVLRNLGEMGVGVGGTISGVAQIAFEAGTLQAVTWAGSAKQGFNAYMDLIQVDEHLQQSVNQSFDMVMQDIQDLNLADLTTFQQVAERRVDFFRSAFGI